MESIENSYCRLCADLKPCSDLINMITNYEKRKEIDHKLERFDIVVNFNNRLPKTVCCDCINALGRAYDFVTTVDDAQEAFKDYNFSITTEELINKSEIASDDINNSSEAPATHGHEDMDIKQEDTSETEGNNENIRIESKDIVKFEPLLTTSEEKTKPQSKPRLKKEKKTMEELELSESWSEYTWLCAYCDRRFQSHSELMIHSMQFHSICNPYKCYDCLMRVPYIDCFIAHICKHRPLLILTCHKCSLVSASLKDMRDHIQSHINSGFYCDGCNTPFSNQKELDEHIGTHFRSEDDKNLPVQENKSSTCFMCHKTFRTRLLLNRHLIIHTDRKRDNICDVCGKSFYKKKELIQHIVVHSDARPFKCEVCKYSFKVKSELKKHLTVHFGPKKFACDTCGRQFRLKKELTSHKLIHSDEKPFVCSVCDKPFRFRHLLVQHVRVHTGDKPYACEKCPQKYRNWSNYNKHMKDIHGIDKAKRRHTSDGLYALDPKTGKIIYPEEEKVIEWKKKLLSDDKRFKSKRRPDMSSSYS